MSSIERNSFFGPAGSRKAHRVRKGRRHAGRCGSLRDGARRPRPGAPSFVELLEPRTLLSAIVLTDQQDYAPGSTAVVTATNDSNAGTNFLPGETVQFRVTRTDGMPDFPPANQPWLVTDGVGGFTPYQDSNGMWWYPDTDGKADGQIGTSWYVDSQYAGASLELTAKGLTSGALATTDFTDGGVADVTVTPSIVNPSTATQFTVVVTDDNASSVDMGSFQVSAPAGFTITSIDSVSFNNSQNLNWSTTIAAGGSSFTASAKTNSDKVSKGQNPAGAVTIKYHATTPATPSGTQSWNIQVFNNIDSSGGPFPTVNATTSVKVTNPTTTSVTGASGTYGGTTTLTATLTSGSTPVAGELVTFTLNGAAFANNTATTNSSGVASLTGVSLAGISAGTYTSYVGASFGGDSNYAPSSGSGTLTVNTKALTITANSTSKTYGQTLTFAGTEFSTSGLISGDSVTGVTLTSTGATATAGVSGSPYPIVPSNATGTGLSNYSIAYVNGTLTVNRKAITVTADAQTKVYGQTEPALTYKVTAGSLVNGDIVTGNLSRVAGENVGTYAIQQGSLSAGSNYSLTYAGANLSISAAALTVTADGKSKVYGAAVPSLTGTLTGVVAGDNITATYSTTATASSPVGSFAITPLLNDPNNELSNYTITSSNGTLTVTPAALTITADNKTKIYGAALPTLTVSYSGFVNNDTSASLTTQPTISSLATAASHVGDYTITASGAASSNYTINYASGTLSVTAVGLTITADNQSRAYGDANPTLTVTYSGFVNNDSSASLTTQPTVSTSATTASGVGAYPIVPSGAIDSDYNISYANGTLTVTTRAIGVRADAQTKVYGQADPALTYGVTSGSLVNGDAFTGGLVRDPGQSVGSYAITQGTLALSSNYTVSFTGNSLTITAAPLTVTADAQSKVYGTSDPALTYKVSGLQLGDMAADVLMGSLTRVAGETVAGSPYAITQGSLVANTNYHLSYVGASLSVAPAGLTVTANPASRVYGDANPAFSASYSGFVNGDDASALSGSPSLTTTADSSSPVGDYTITAALGTLADSNYTFSFVNDTLAIFKATLTITAADASRTYGAANPALTGTVVGIKNSDSISGSFTTTAVATTDVGQYPITAQAVDGSVDNRLANYDVHLINATLTINPSHLSVTADARDKIYGAALDPSTLTGSIQGVQNGDTITASYSSVGDLAATTVGDYAIAASLSGPKLILDYVVDSDLSNVGTLTVKPAALTITANSLTKSYGDTVIFAGTEFTTAGLVNGNTVASVSLASPGTTPSATVAGAPYDITPSAATGTGLGNYTISYVPGKLSINKAALNVTADDQSKTYGQADPTLTGTLSGVVAGDDITATYSTAAGKFSDVAAGGYLIHPSLSDPDGRLANYDVTVTDGTLTINQAEQQITWSTPAAIMYGTTLGAAQFNAMVAGVAGGASPGTLTYTPTVGTLLHAGSHQALGVSAAETIDYKPASATVYIDVLKADPFVQITGGAGSFTYDGAPHAATASVTGVVASDDLGTPTITYNGSANAPVSAGGYTVIASFAGNSDYNPAQAMGSIIIGQATPTVVWADPADIVYGTALSDTELNASASRGIGGPAVSGTFTYSSPAGTVLAAGLGQSLTATFTPDDTVDYTGASATVHINVTQAQLTVEVQDSTKVYGQANPSFTVSYSGLVNGDDPGSLGGLLSFSTAATPGSHVQVGGYSVSASGLTSPNYNIQFVDGILTIAPASLQITANDAMKIYGAPLPALSAAYSGFVNGDSEASLAIAPTVTTDATAASHVGGSYKTSASGAVDNDYSISYIDGTLTVTPAPLTISADNKSMVYGGTLPTLAASYSGLVNGDQAVAVTGLALATVSASSHVGDYPIAASGATDPDYTITLVSGTLSITPAQLTVVANDATKVYGEANPALGVTYQGFVNGDTVGSLASQATASTAATGASPVGDVPISASGAADPDYNMVYQDGTLKITPRALVITALDQSKAYGDQIDLGTTGFTTNAPAQGTGLVNKDSVDGVVLSSVGADAAATVGQYDITAANATGTGLGNYAITYVTGTLAVGKADLTITADDASRVYGDANPALTGSIVGIKNNDAITATYTTWASATSPVGLYTIVPAAVDSADLKLSNYNVHIVNGTLSVTPATLNIYGTDTSREYGDPNPAFTGTYSGEKNGETFTITGATPATQTSEVGEYAISPAAAGATLSNYIVVPHAGILTITHATLTVTADDAHKVYGTTNPTFMASYNGFKNGEDLASSGVSGAPDLATTAIEGSWVGAYTITADLGSLTSANYVFTFVPGVLTVTPRALTVTAAANSKIYDATRDAAATPVISSGALYGSDSVDFSESYDDKKVGTNKSVTPSGSVLDGNGGQNYSVTFVAANVGTVTPATLSATGITANDKVYDGTAVASLNKATGALSGQFDGDNVTLSPAAATGAFGDKNVGQNKTVQVSGLTLTGIDADNYILVQPTTTASITPLGITGIVTAYGKVYDGTLAATLATRTLLGVVDGDQVNYVGGTAAFGDRNVGSGQTVTATGLSLTGADTGNYTVNTTATTTADITPAGLTISAVANKKVYDGTTLAAAIPTVNGLQVGDSVTDLVESFADKSVGTGKALSITGYMVIDGNGGHNYTITAVGNAAGVICPRPITVTAATDSRTYDGRDNSSSVPTITAGQLADGDTVVWTEHFDSRNAGARTLIPTGVVSDGYAGNNYAVSFVTAPGSIDKAPLVIAAVTDAKTYDGTARSTSVPVVLGAVFAGDSVTGLMQAFGSKNVMGVGDSTLMVTGYSVNDSNFGNNYAVSTPTAAGTISPLGIIGTISVSDKTYDGTPTATISSRSLSGLLSLDSVDYSGGSASFSDKNVGAGKMVTATGLYLTGADADNYSVNSTALTTAAITPRLLTVTATGVDKIYDGTNAATVTLADNRLTGDMFSDRYSAAAFGDKNVGAAKPVSVSGIAISGSDAGNYAFNTAANTTANITKRDLTVTATGVNKVYDGNTVATVTLSDNRVSGDVFDDNDTSASFSDKNVGTSKQVSVSDISVAGTDAGNYRLLNITAAASADITKAALTITAQTSTKTYDGGVSALAVPSVAGVQPGDSVGGLSETYDNRNAGTGKALSVATYSVNDGNGGNNYTITTLPVATGVINPLAIVGSITADNKIYDGTTAATISGRSLSGVLGLDDVHYVGGTATFADKNVGSGKTVSATGLSLSGADAGNYTVNPTAMAIADVTPAGLTINAIVNTKIYDGGTSAAAIPTETGLQPGDTVTGKVEAYTDPAVGTDKVLNVTAYTVNDSNGGHNYMVTTVSSNAGAISQATPTVNVTDSGGVYNGKQAGFAATASVAGVSGIYGPTLEGVAPTLTYYSGKYFTLLSLPPGGGSTQAPITVGDYTVLASFGGSADYAAAFALANFKITTATLTVTASNASRQYSDPNPIFTGNYSNAQNGETFIVSGTTTATPTSPVNSYPITPTVTGSTLSNYTVVFVPGTLNVTQEDATTTYTGLQYISVPSGTNTANVILSATVVDAPDGYPGDITTATVTFFILETNQYITAPVVLVNPSNHTVGTASATVALSAGTNSNPYAEYTVYTLVGYNSTGNYLNYTPATGNMATVYPSPAAIDISQAVSGSIGGGGFIVNKTGAGMYAGDVGAKTNFGLNVKYNKSGTNLQGSVNIIAQSNGHTYQIKSNSINSLATQNKGTYSYNGTTYPIYKAQFSSKANLTDITNPTNPISLGGNLALQIQMTDNGEPGSNDTIAIALSGSNGGLLFSSAWSGTQTVEQTLVGGNLQVRPAQFLDAPSVPVATAGGMIGAAELQSLVPAAIARWAAQGVPADLLAALANQQYVVENLPAGQLGWQTGNTIAMDAHASGYGWFVDPTPMDDSEFASGQSTGAAAGRVDLLTVLMHEMGHVLGYYEDADGSGTVMSEGLAPGVRHTAELLGANSSPASLTPAASVSPIASQATFDAAATPVPSTSGLSLITSCRVIAQPPCYTPVLAATLSSRGRNVQQGTQLSALDLALEQVFLQRRRPGRIRRV